MSTKSESHTQSCYARIRRLLLLRQIQPGARLTEASWAERLSVSRGAIREAMNMLAHEGLLTRGENGGFFAPVLGTSDLREILEVRMALELGAIRLMAIREVENDRLAELRGACLTMEQTLEAGLDLGFEEADRRFHEVIVDLAGNSRLSRVYQQAPLPVSPSSDPDDEVRRASNLKTLDEHRSICEHLESRAYERTAELLERHLMTSYDLTPIVS